LPFGLATFARQPARPDWDKLNGADVVVLGTLRASEIRAERAHGKLRLN